VTCVRWYCRFSLSLRDLEELMAERGLAVDHTFETQPLPASPHCRPSRSRRLVIFESVIVVLEELAFQPFHRYQCVSYSMVRRCKSFMQGMRSLGWPARRMKAAAPSPAAFGILKCMPFNRAADRW
jgi:hypothetical protein